MGQYGFSVKWNKEGDLLPITDQVSKTGWRIEDHESFMLLINSKNGKTIHIYANKPDRQSDGQNAMDIWLKERVVRPTVVVHRGHSYHFQDTVEKIPKSAIIVYAGSCGGYNNIAEVLERAKNVYYISTKGTGTMLVNDAVLFLMNNAIVDGKDIQLADF